MEAKSTRRIPEYLSPTSLDVWRKDRKEFYLTYLSQTRAPRFPQTQPMSIGSAFDAYVKSHLYQALFGKNHNPQFDFQTLFEKQVEPHNRDWAFKHGKYAYDCYVSYGCLADLMFELSKAIGPPRFEFELKGIVRAERSDITRTFDKDLRLSGKPDIFFVNKYAKHVEYDFKVNGYCGKGNTSPKRGFVKCRPANNMHKDCYLTEWNGFVINGAEKMHTIDVGWARQLSIYSWLCGVDVGVESIAAIDQLACAGTGAEFPAIRVAEHRCLLDSEFQWQLYKEATQVWEIIHSNHIFRDMTLEQSQELCDFLEKQAEMLRNPADENERLFNEITREQRNY